MGSGRSRRWCWGRKRRRALVAGWASAVLAVSGVAFAAPGDLDPSFGFDGLLAHGFPSSSDSNPPLDEGSAITVQSDGKLVVAGFSDQGTSTDPDWDFAVARYNVDGTLDPTFSGDGLRTIGFGSPDDVALAVAMEGSKIIVGGYSDQGGSSAQFDFAIARLNPDGTLDASFDGPGGNGNGSFLVNIGDDDTITALATNGTRITAAGYSDRGGSSAVNYNFASARFLSTTGAFDSTWDGPGGNGNGKFTSDFGSIDDQANAIVISGNSTILAGYSDQGPDCCIDNDVALIKYTNNGSLDTAFDGPGGDGNGKFTIDFNSVDDQALAMALSGTKLVLAGFSDRGPDCCVQNDFLVARLNSNGTLDTTFDGDSGNGNGRVFTNMGSDDDQALAVALQSNAKIVVAGWGGPTPDATGEDFALARYGANGVLDTTFDGDGKVFTDFAGANDEAWGVAIQPNGRIVAAGFSAQGDSDGLDFALARYQGDPRCTITGTTGNDILLGTSGDDVLCGMGGEDAIDGAAGSDVLLGGDGSDLLKGGEGRDFFDGEGGTDTVHFSGATTGVQASLATGSATGEGSDQLVSVERLEGSPHSDTLSGDGGPNRLFGGAGEDTLKGEGGADSLVGESGDDFLQGGTGTDSVMYMRSTSAVTVDLGAQSATGEGTDSLDSIEGTTGSPQGDNLTGTTGPNTILGGDGGDAISAGDGADLVIPGEGDDSVDGGPAADTVDFRGAAAGVTASLTTADASGEGADGLQNFEHINGGPFADTLTGDSRPNAINGRSGADALHGGDGTDKLSGEGDGDDLFGEGGPDALVGGDGDDDLQGGSEADSLVGNLGNDNMAGGEGIDIVRYTTSLSAVTVDLVASTATGEGSDGIVEVERILGTKFNDSLTGGSEAVELSGFPGNDTINGGAGADTLLGGGGVDTINGNDGSDKLNGGPGSDQIDGGAQSDILIGGTDDDSMNGGDGVDTVTYSDATAPITASLESGTSTGQGSDTLTSLEVIAGSGFDDILTGNDGPNTIRGGSGNDDVFGRAGADRLLGASGNDDLFGEAGDDYLFGQPGTDVLDGGDDNDRCDGGAGADTFNACETETS
jgi:uncharacterized delta-60 repeat protein